jgi:DNA-binding Xre family transcriptional regulator
MVSYNKLWKLLIDKGMMKKDLMQEAGISKSTIIKLNHGESVTTDTLARICNSLKCDMGDIMEFIPDKK